MPGYLQGFNLMIADDHQLIIDGLKRILCDEKWVLSIYSAHNGQEAVKLAMENDIECILMDIEMPLLNGYEATKIIKETKPGTRVIILSMICDSSVVAKLLRAGADGFIIKNTGQEELIKAIQKVMCGEKYVSPELNLDLFGQVSKRKNKITREDHLTRRELEIVQLISEGFTNHEIAQKLFLSSATVDTHRKNILAKLDLPNTAALVRYASDSKLL